jgi:hypothetical protein
LFAPESPLIRDARYALVLQLIALAIGVVSFLVDPVAGAIIIASLILVVGAWSLYALNMRERSGAPYEVLELDQNWDLYDATGNEASSQKRLKLRFLQNDVIALRDFLWGDVSNTIQDYSWSPGRVVEQYQTGPRLQILIALDTVRNRGDIDTYIASYRSVGAFTSSQEWISFMATKPTDKLKVTVTFPKERPTKSISFTDGFGNYIDPERYIKRELNEGREKIQIELYRPPLEQEFALRWDW